MLDYSNHYLADVLIKDASSCGATGGPGPGGGGFRSGNDCAGGGGSSRTSGTVKRTSLGEYDSSKSAAERIKIRDAKEKWMKRGFQTNSDLSQEEMELLVPEVNVGTGEEGLSNQYKENYDYREEILNAKAEDSDGNFVAIAKRDAGDSDAVKAIKEYSNNSDEFAKYQRDPNAWKEERSNRSDYDTDEEIRKRSAIIFGSDLLNEMASKPLLENGKMATVYRGAGPREASAILKQIKKSDNIEFKTVLSTSFEPVIASRFDRPATTESFFDGRVMNETREGVFMKIKTKTGVYIAPDSKYMNEAEVVLPKNSRFKVTKHETLTDFDGEQRLINHFVTLEES